jgi:hypothetical protein
MKRKISLEFMEFTVVLWEVRIGIQAMPFRDLYPILSFWGQSYFCEMREPGPDSSDQKIYQNRLSRQKRRK